MNRIINLTVPEIESWPFIDVQGPFTKSRFTTMNFRLAFQLELYAQHERGAIRVRRRRA